LTHATYLNSTISIAKCKHIFFQYIDQQKTLEALAAFKTAINLKNDHVGAWMNQALLLEKSGK